MSLAYCESCDRVIDTDFDDGVWDGNVYVCQSCHNERELEFATWQALTEGENNWI